jgi:putative solute:sodium symporter small subunit|tara:strand:- start:1491 stop:1784 length:294 start_codon:yes stop_codon:yes gene_type:complete
MALNNNNKRHVMKQNTNTAEQYWQRNLRIIFSYLTVWFVVSFGCGIIFVDELNQFSLFGFKLGYWFANQGSILVFCLLTIGYAVRMSRLDNEFDVHE